MHNAIYILDFINFRPATLSDHDQLLSLIVAFELGEAALENEKTDAEEMKKKVARHLKESLAEPSRRYFVAEKDDKLVGFVSGEISASAKGTAWFHGLYVDESKRGVGVGKKLMEEILAWFRASGVKRAKLGVHKKNADAINLYKKIRLRAVRRNLFTYGKETLTKYSKNLSINSGRNSPFFVGRIKVTK